MSLPNRCPRCRKPRCHFGLNTARGVCFQCCLELDELHLSVARDKCCRQSSATMNTANARFNAVVHHKCIWKLILEFTICSKSQNYRAQAKLWLKVLRGKWLWSFFDCDAAVSHEFSGWFGVNSVNLVGPHSRHPVHLQVLFGVKLTAKNRKDRFIDSSILDLVIDFLGAFQPWMV